MTLALARAISIFGHPLVLLPLAVLALTVSAGDGKQLPAMAAGLAVFATVVMGFSWWQVKRGQWRHVDASGADERVALNRLLMAMLALGTLGAQVLGAPFELVLGLGLAAAMVVAAAMLGRWCKLSLHMAFAVNAAWLLGMAHPWAGVAGFAFAALVAWSRLQLQRHVPRDLMAGAVAGTVAGIVFKLLTAGMGS